jgi:hypothetical protein
MRVDWDSVLFRVLDGGTAQKEEGPAFKDKESGNADSNFLRRY